MLTFYVELNCTIITLGNKNIVFFSREKSQNRLINVLNDDRLFSKVKPWCQLPLYYLWLSVSPVVPPRGGAHPGASALIQPEVRLSYWGFDGNRVPG